MKTAVRHTRRTAHRRYRHSYPNAADAAYFLSRAVDGTLAVVTVFGAVTAFLFLMTL